MRSMQIIDWGQPLEARNQDLPKPAGTEVLVKVDACGVCHTDLHLWDGYFDLGGGDRIVLAERGVKLPFTMGHETVGEVVALGPDVDPDVDPGGDGVAIGDKRIVFPWIGCGKCAVCLEDQEMLCLKAQFVGTRVAGGYSDHVLVPHAKYLIAYGDIPSGLAATYACSGITAYSAVKKLGPLRDTDHLVIVGAGGVGMNGIQLARAMLDAKIIVADIDATKRSVARQAGADETVDPNDPDALAKIHKLTGGGAAAAIDFVGAPASSRFGIDSLRKGGTHIVVGLYGDKLPMALPLFPMMALTVRGSYVGSLAEMHELMELVLAGKVAPIPITPRPLDEANQVLEDLRAGKIVGRVVLTP